MTAVQWPGCLATLRQWMGDTLRFKGGQRHRQAAYDPDEDSNPTRKRPAPMQKLEEFLSQATTSICVLHLRQEPVPTIVKLADEEGTEPQEISGEAGEPAFLLVLCRSGPQFLPPRSLGAARAACSQALRMLHSGCHLQQLMEQARKPLRGAASETTMLAEPPPRRLQRGRILQDCQGIEVAVCSSNHSLALVAICEGRVFSSVAVDPFAGWSVSKERWVQVLDPIGEPSCEIVSVCMSPCALFAVDLRGRVLAASLYDGSISSSARIIRPTVGLVAAGARARELGLSMPAVPDEAAGKMILRWTQVPGLEAVQAQAVQSRFGQVFVVTCQGDLYAWGQFSGDGTPARACSVGLPGSLKNLPEAVRVSGVPGVDRFGFGRAPVTSVACGVAHSIFISESGTYSVGQGDKGQLGYGGLGDSMVPIRMSLAAHVRVRTASCGLHQTLLATTDGEAWGCGSSLLGELPLRRFAAGVITPQMALDGFTRWAFEPVPRRLDLLPDKKKFFVISTACGLCSSFFVCESGAVFMSGTVHCGGPTPYGRPKELELQQPYQLQGLLPVREMAVSLNVPLQLPGIPFATLPEASEERPAELCMFRCAFNADDVCARTLLAWAAPGWSAPVQIQVPQQPLRKAQA